MRYLFKYNIKSRGREGNDNTWSIEDLDSKEIILVDHIEFKVPISTQEKQLGLGFGMTCEGVITYKEHPSVGKYAVITKE